MFLIWTSLIPFPVSSGAMGVGDVSEAVLITGTGEERLHMVGPGCKYCVSYTAGEYEPKVDIVHCRHQCLQWSMASLA